MANVFPTNFAALTPGRDTVLLGDNGTINGSLTVAQILALLQTSDIYSKLLTAYDTVEDVPSTTTVYNVTLADNGKVKRFLCSTACVVNVPLGLPLGFAFEWVQDGAGILTFQSAQGAGQTLQSPEGLRSGGQFGSGVLRVKAANTWQLAGYTQV